jgi:beta-galactosidase
MKHIIIFLLLIFVSSFPGYPQEILTKTGSTRERLLMDFDWRFAFGHPCDTEKDLRHASGYFSYFAKTGYGDGPAAAAFDDRAWRLLNLPHDWAVEQPFDRRGSYSHGYKAVGSNFPEHSIGWYRKAFFIPESDLGKRISIEFDGIHRNSVVWVNGFYLGHEPSGYYNFHYDVTDYINYGGKNTVAVRVDVTMEEGWYYEGAGIYRHVWLNKTDPLHVDYHGTFVISELKDGNADLVIRTTVVNDGTAEKTFDIIHNIITAEGKSVAAKELEQLILEPGEKQEYSCIIPVSGPTLWSLETPYLYKLSTAILIKDHIIDHYETPFGIRTVHFDPDQGFFLNGQPLKLKGTNNHQDHAGVGTALPDALQEFRIACLKKMGCNAYRCSHNPPTPELLDACDRLGMLVIDENRLMGTTAELLDRLQRMILRDRNHPCVFIWSIGNEEWAIEGNIKGARIATTMQAFVRRLDPTRYITYANSGWGSGISEVIDVMGFNYIFNGDIDKQHADFPDQPAVGTEESTSKGTRGIYQDDPVNAHMEATDRKLSGRSIETGFNFYTDRPFLSGLFFWTGFDYRGEANPFGWPQVGSQYGILDLCGFPKDMFYYLKSWWSVKPVLHLLPHWNWQGKEGQEINVWAYSNCDEVELFLNNKTQGRKIMPKNSHLQWKVNYEPGTLLAHGYKNGEEIITEQVVTTGEATNIKLIPNRPTIKADGEDISVITVEVHDRKGQLVPAAGNEISFSLKGPGRIIGVGNGDPSSHEPDKYFETIRQLKIENLKSHAVKSKETYPEISIDFNDSCWPSAIDNQGNYNIKTSDTLKTMIIRGIFNLSDLRADTKITLWPKSLGEEQAIYLNGQLIAQNIKRDDAVQAYQINPAILHKGKNVYAIVGTPLVPRYLYDNLNTDPGIIQLTTPAATWKRKVFNGLAQVILQSLPKSGEIILTAGSPGLQETAITIRAQAAILRPAVLAE